MRSRNTGIIAFLLAVALSSCGQLNSLARQSAGSAADDAVIVYVTDAPAGQLEARVESRGINETLSLVSRRSGHEIWRAESGDTLTLREGVIVSTTALTPDLISVETTFPSEWRPTARPAIASRVHRYVDGDEQMFLRGYQCEYSATVPETIKVSGSSRSTYRTDESCNNPTQSFSNTYWLDGSGRMVQSRQWLGPEVGYLRLNYPQP